jgi:hypothetical protein
MKVAPAEPGYATVRKRREKGGVVEVARTLAFGTPYLLGGLPKRSTASRTINTSLVGRNNGFSRDLTMCRAASYFIRQSHNFC